MMLRPKTSIIILGICISFVSSCQSQHTKKMRENHTYTNELIHEASPYLLQHAHNPVNWMPWGKKAFEKAKKEDKLVLVSVGYSACHWCHVMEHESFEDTAVARIMNENFVCIKVDREERPDVDEIYMTAVQIMTQRGGWPLNCFALPDGRPVYGGTYFRKNQWIEILENLSQTYQNDKQRVLEYAENLTEAVKANSLIQITETPSEFSEDWLDDRAREFTQNWDLVNGGHQRAPKFPLPSKWRFLLQYAHLEDQSKIKEHIFFTLDKMAAGGIYDHIGGGFARYSTDAQWKVPHFEKMLYDNGQLLTLFCEAYRLHPSRNWEKTIFEITEWIEREMTHPEGGFYAALDADSEGKEGKFYIWTKKEVQSILTDEEWKIAEACYSFNPKGLWEHDHYIPLVSETDEKLCKELNLKPNELEEKREVIRQKLLTERSKRIRPGLDDKIITSWNALTISGLLDVYKTFGDERHLKMAQNAIDFILKKGMENGKLLRYYKEGGRKTEGFSEDYAYFIQSLMNAYQTTSNEEHLSLAKQLTEVVLSRFSQENELFFSMQASDQNDLLIANPVGVTDDVTPSSNAIMAQNLFMLGKMYYKDEWVKRAQDMCLATKSHVEKYALGHASWLTLYQWQTETFHEVVIAGKKADEFRKELQQQYIPNQVVAASDKSNLPVFEDKFVKKETQIYVCRNRVCEKPTNNVKEALDKLK